MGGVANRWDKLLRKGFEKLWVVAGTREPDTEGPSLPLCPLIRDGSNSKETQLFLILYPKASEAKVYVKLLVLMEGSTTRDISPSTTKGEVKG